MEITKVVKPFIRRGRPYTFGNIVYIMIYTGKVHHWYIVLYNHRWKLKALILNIFTSGRHCPLVSQAAYSRRSNSC